METMHVQNTAPPNRLDNHGDEPDNALVQLALDVLKRDWRKLAALSIAGGVIGVAASFLIPPTYTARVSFISPQQQQNSAAAALASLGALSGLAGSSVGLRSPADQYVALLQSVTIADRIVDQFKLMDLYDEKLRVDTRKELASRLKVSAGKKDNIITVEVDDHDPQRAAEMANRFVHELRVLSNGLTLTEAQQRRAFFELQLTAARDKLAQAQGELQRSGFNPGMLKNEPKAAAEAYAKLKAEIAALEVRISASRRLLAEGTPELQQQLAALGSLRSQLTKLEEPLNQAGQQDYVGAYRNYKYQETLFDIFSRQFELAKLDEAREGTLFQVVDAAQPPERKSKPKRSMIGIGSTIAVFLLLGIRSMLQERRRRLIAG